MSYDLSRVWQCRRDNPAGGRESLRDARIIALSSRDVGLAADMRSLRAVSGMRGMRRAIAQ